MKSNGQINRGFRVIAILLLLLIPVIFSAVNVSADTTDRQGIGYNKSVNFKYVASPSSGSSSDAYAGDTWWYGLTPYDSGIGLIQRAISTDINDRSGVYVDADGELRANGVVAVLSTSKLNSEKQCVFPVYAKANDQYTYEPGDKNIYNLYDRNGCEFKKYYCTIAQQFQSLKLAAFFDIKLVDPGTLICVSRKDADHSELQARYVYMSDTQRVKNLSNGSSVSLTEAAAGSGLYRVTAKDANGNDNTNNRKIFYMPTAGSMPGSVLLDKFFEQGIFVSGDKNATPYTSYGSINQAELKKYDIKSDGSDDTYHVITRGPRLDISKLNKLPGKIQSWAAEGTYTSAAKNVVSYCMSLDSSLNSNPSGKLSNWLAASYEKIVGNKYMPQIELEGSDSDYPNKVKLVNGNIIFTDDTDIKLIDYLTAADTSDDYMISYYGNLTGFDYPMNVYNVCYLDLLSCIYISAYSECGPDAAVTKVWYDVIDKYCHPEENNWDPDGCHIAITNGVIAVGDTGIGDGVHTVYSGLQELTEYVYGIKAQGSPSVDDDTSTISKGYKGYYVSTGGKFHSAQFGQKVVSPDPKTGCVDKNNAGDPEIKKIYVSYYTRMENALRGNSLGGTNSFGNTPSKNVNALDGNVTTDDQEYVYNKQYWSLGEGLDPYWGPAGQTSKTNMMWYGSGVVNRCFYYLYYYYNSDTNRTMYVKNPNNQLGAATKGLISVLYGEVSKKVWYRDLNAQYGMNLIVAYQWSNQAIIVGENEDYKWHFETEDEDKNEGTLPEEAFNKTVNILVVTDPEIDTETEEYADYDAFIKDGKLTLRFNEVTETTFPEANEKKSLADSTLTYKTSIESIKVKKTVTDKSLVKTALNSFLSAIQMTDKFVEQTGGSSYELTSDLDTFENTWKSTADAQNFKWGTGEKNVQEHVIEINLKDSTAAKTFIEKAIADQNSYSIEICYKRTADLKDKNIDIKDKVCATNNNEDLLTLTLVIGFDDNKADVPVKLYVDTETGVQIGGIEKLSAGLKKLSLSRSAGSVIDMAGNRYAVVGDSDIVKYGYRVIDSETVDSATYSTKWYSAPAITMTKSESASTITLSVSEEDAEKQLLWMIPVKKEKLGAELYIGYYDAATGKTLKTKNVGSVNRGDTVHVTADDGFTADIGEYVFAGADKMYYITTDDISELLEYSSARNHSTKTVSATGEDISVTIPSDMASGIIWVGYNAQKPVVKASYYSEPDGYAELKEGQVNTVGNKNMFTETFEAMAGVPSTETLYFSTGGSEFIVSLLAESSQETVKRTYETVFNGTECEFKKTDSLDGGTTGTKRTKSFAVNNTSGKTITTSHVNKVAETYNMVNPVGSSSYNTTFSAHTAASSPITATWTGTITNTTSDPGVTDIAAPWDNIASTGEHYSGKPGEMVQSGQESAGGSYSWDVSAYNTALQNAYNWAKQLEDYSDGEGNIVMLANSDGVTRTFHLGDAEIKITFSGLNSVTNSNAYHTEGHLATLSNTTLSTDTWDSYKLESNDTRLSSGYFEVYGHAEGISGSSCVSSISRNGKYDEDVTDTWTDEKDLAAFTPSQQSRDVQNNGGSWSISCSINPPSCSGTFTDAGKTTVTWESKWCGYDCGAPLKDASGHSFKACGTHKEVDSEEVQEESHYEDDYDDEGNVTGSHKVIDTPYKAEVSHMEGNGDHSFTLDSGANMTPASHTCHASHSVSGYVETKTQKQGNVSYTIVVTFKNTHTEADGNEISCPNGTLPAHAICGPCCSHDLQELRDRWTQEYEIYTIKITDLKVWRLDSGYVKGMTEITGDAAKDILKATGTVTQNIFYNIAASSTSKDGRIRYSLQTGQDDEVLWTEMNALKENNRSHVCDGLGKTVSPYNPAPDGGAGHAEEWAYGCLYHNMSFGNKEDAHKVAASGDKTSRTNASTDARDMLTEEWQRFDMRRNMDVRVTVISDFVILQSTSGDESIVYHEAFQTVKAQQNPEELLGVTWGQLWTGNPLVKKSTKLNVGSYNGKYSLVDSNAAMNKYTGTGNGNKITTIFDDMPTTSTSGDGDAYFYSNAYDTKSDGTVLGLAKVQNKRSVHSASSQIKSSPGASEIRVSRPVIPLLLKLNDIAQKITNPNKEYVTGQSYAFYEEVLSYGNAGNLKYQTTRDTITGKNGYTVESKYTDGQTKINNIVVQDPVSVVGAMILQPDSPKDQRVLVESNAARLNLSVSDTGTCPGTAAECVNRYLDCKYFNDTMLGLFTIDNNKVFTYTDDEDNPISSSTFIYDAGGNISVSITGGFEVKTDTGNEHLEATIPLASQPVKWSYFDLDLKNVLTRAFAEADYVVSASQNTALMGTDVIQITMDTSGYIHIKFGGGLEYKGSTAVSRTASDTREFHLKASFDNGTTEVPEVYVNGIKQTFTQVGTGNIVASGKYMGTTLYIGTSFDTGVNNTGMRVDNIIITRRGGTSEHTTACYDKNGKLICTEPHHQKDANGNCLHYGYDSEVCYSACHDDSLHKTAAAEIKDSSGRAIQLANYIFLDNEFTVYYPNYGDFYETDLHGIANTTQMKGIGYVNNMDTNKWLREKWASFPFAVLYYRESSGQWEQYEAGQSVQLDKNYEYYKFYCLLKNNEASAASVSFISEAINNYPGYDDHILYQDCPSLNDWSTNRMRLSSLKSYHSAYKGYYIDVIGRIGNLIIEDTDDLRFADLFKTPTDDDKWYIKGIIKAVDSAKQRNFGCWLAGEDIRGNKLTTLITQGIGFNTYGTLPWATGTEYNGKAGAFTMPISSDKNNILSLKSESLKLGYKILWDVSTIGDYMDGHVEVKPYVYALNIKTEELIPVDVYSPNDSSELKAVNFFGLYDEDESTKAGLLSNLSEYMLYLDWTEKERRNYGPEEQLATVNVVNNVTEALFNADGSVAERTVIVPATADAPEHEVTSVITRSIAIPMNTKYNPLGNLQLMTASATARTFIGSSVVNGVNINGSNQTELNNPTGSQWRYNKQGQRWHMYMGLPSNAVFVPYNGTTHTDPYEIKTDPLTGKNYYAKDEIKGEDPDYVFLLTADITAFGDVYTLHYDQSSNGTFTTTDRDGVTKIWNTDGYFDSLPTLFAVYQGQSTIDITIRNTH